MKVCALKTICNRKFIINHDLGNVENILKTASTSGHSYVILNGYEGEKYSDRKIEDTRNLIFITNNVEYITEYTEEEEEKEADMTIVDMSSRPQN